MLAVLLLPFALQAQNTQTFDFEDNAIPADWTNDATHPWVVTSTSEGSGHNGTYCIMSSNAGVASSTSTISATFTFVGDGSITFLAGIYGEGTSTIWDKCIFKIDGEQQFSYGALATWATYSFDVEAGIHTFEWTYSKDGSVNPTGDAFYLDDIVVDLGIASSCPKPLAIALGTITENSIDITWTPGGSETAWNVYLYDETGDLLPGYPDNASTAEYSFTGLTANTPYTIGVKANCGDELSAERTISARTACDAVSTFPWTEDFESYPASSSGVTFNAPCWINEHISGSGTYFFEVYSSTTDMGGNPTQMLRLHDMTSGTMTKLVLPLMDLPAENYAFTLSVYRNVSTANYGEGIRVYASTNGEIDGASELAFISRSYTTSDGNNIPAETESGWYTYTLPIGISGSCYIILRGESLYGSATYMDNFIVDEGPTCIPVTALTVDSTTSNSITLSWTDDINSGATYTIYDMSDSTILASGISELTYTIENLNASSSYSFGVAADCGSDDLSDIRIANCRTECDILASLPWTENFESVPSGSYQMPYCWARYTSAFTTSVTYPYSYYSSSSYAHSGTRVLYFYGATGSTYPDTMMAITPALDVNLYPMDGNRVTFWGRTSSATIDKIVYVGTMTNPADPATFTFVDSVVVSGDILTLYSALLTTAHATDPYVAFLVKKGSGSLYIDDVTLDEIPSCFEVSDVTVSNITANSITLNWVDAQNSGATYSIYMGNNLVGTSSDTTYTVTDLQANTEYTFGVEANCDNGNGNIMTISARTACDAYELPFTENFDASLANDPCWGGASILASDVFGGTPLTQGSITGWSYQSTDNNGIPAGHYRVNIYGANCKYWLITPLIDLSAVSSPLLSFDAAFTKYSGIALADGDISDDKFMVIISTDGGQTWDSTNAISFNLSSLNSLTYITQYVDLSNYAGDAVKIAFYGESTVSGGDNNLHIDNILIEESTGTICLPVSMLAANNVTASEASLSWTGNADSYNVYTIADGDTTFLQNVTEASLDITGLNAMTSYTYGVCAVCSNDESPMATVTFSTACTALTLPYTETFETTSGTLNCWSVEGAGNWTFGTGDYSAATGAFQGSQNAKITHTVTGNVTKLISPALDDVQNGMTLDFAYVLRSWSGDIDELRVYVRSAADSDWQMYGEYTNATEAWTTQSLIIPGTVYQVAFEHTDNYGYGIGLDSVVFAPVTGDFCFPVADLSVDTITGNSATISWTGTAASYDVYIGSSFVANVTSTSYTFTGLTPSTNYTFGVQAICSATDSAAMVTVAAATECGTIDAYPYVQDFTTAPSCWMILDADGDGQNWILYQGTIQSASYNSGALTPDNWLISPQFAIPAAGNYEVTWTATAQDQSWPAEHYGVFVSTTGYSDTANFTMLQEWTLGPGIFNPVVDLSNYAGQNIYIALRHFNCTDQFRLSIDEFIVREQAGANQVTINAGPNNPAYGTVSGTGIYNIGDNVTLTATANTGHVFSKWVDESNTILSTDNPYTFVAATDLNLTAIFLDNTGATYTITVQVNDSTMGTAVGGGTYTAGEQITLTATPNPGYNFVNWTQVSGFGTNVVGTDPDLIITVTSDKTFVANFEAGSTPGGDTLTINLSINYPALGTITPAPGTYHVAFNDTLMLTATPNPGVDFNGWGMFYNGQGLGVVPAGINPFPLVVNANMLSLGELDVVAMFSDSTTAPDSMTVIVNTADAIMGTTIPAPGIYKYAVGDTVSLTAAPNDGYSFLYWIETVSVSGMTLSDTITSLTGTLVVPQMYAGMTLSVTAYFQEIVPCETPTNLHASAFDAHSITIGWNTNGNATSWNVRYRVGDGEWSSANATTNTYVMNGLQASTVYEIEVQADCGNGNLSDWSEPIHISTAFDGIESWLQNSVSLYPNPAREYVDIRVNGDVNVKNMEVYDVYGKLINTVNVIDNPTRINVSNLANGMYFVRVTTEMGMVTKTFIKK